VQLEHTILLGELDQYIATGGEVNKGTCGQVQRQIMELTIVSNDLDRVVRTTRVIADHAIDHTYHALEGQQDGL
jgi:hypothetical protein